jgi:NAD(P)-dependent dehydrogenase (short-subunit alcohol dehydrogenase family)
MKNILITGVSTGIGYELVKVFAQGGYKVFGSLRKPEDAEKLSDEFGATFHPLIFDVTDEKAINAAISEVRKSIGDEGLSGLINNAGIAIGGPVMHTPVEDYRRQFEVNLFGVVAVTKAFLPMLGAVKNYAKTPGKIINVSSVSGQIAYPFLGPYCASKFALEGFSQVLRRELLLYGIDVIVIGPGAVKTPIWKKSKTVSPEMLDSDYAPALSIFTSQLKKNVQNAIESGDLAQSILNVFMKKHPKTRYTFQSSMFFRYILPKYFIPPRILDKLIRKMFGWKQVGGV